MLRQILRKPGKIWLQNLSLDGGALPPGNLTGLDLKNAAQYSTDNVNQISFFFLSDIVSRKER